MPLRGKFRDAPDWLRRKVKVVGIDGLRGASEACNADGLQNQSEENHILKRFCHLVVSDWRRGVWEVGGRAFGASTVWGICHSVAA